MALKPVMTSADVQENNKYLLKKWEPFLKGVGDGKPVGQKLRSKLNTAQLLENENDYFAKEQANLLLESGAGVASVDSGGGAGTGIARFRKIAIPLVRRIFPYLIGNDLVGVQPMQGPVGLAYALRYRYQSTGGTDAITGAAIDPSTELGYNNISTNYTGTPYSTYDGERLNGYPNFDGAISGSDMREAGLSVEYAEVIAKTRKLKTRWSLEAQQDLMAMHNLDVEAEMTDALSYELSAEIDREILNRVVARAQTGGNYSFSTATTDGRWEQEKYRNLFTLFLKASNDIARSTRLGAGNIIVGSSDVITAIESLKNFFISPVTDENVSSENAHIAKVGKMDRFTVYRDLFATTDYGVVAFKGTKEEMSGIFYCPYIPIMFSKAVNPESLQPIVGVMTRYGLIDHLFGASLFYRYICVNSLGLSLADSATAC